MPEVESHMPIIEIRHPSEIVPCIEGICKAAELAKDSLSAASVTLRPLDLIARLKFSNAGMDVCGGILRP